MIYTAYYESPIGTLKIEANALHLISISFIENKENGNMQEKNSITMDTINQLDEYFKGERKEFTLPIKRQGTEFQKTVLNQVEKIPYGQTTSYKEIATAINKEKASRAIGNANNKNALLIVVPCHRVIGSNGKLVGYAGGLWRKEWLLHLEKGETNNNR